MNILRKYYNLCAEILKEDLSCIPPMNITNAKKYNGQITIKEVDKKENIIIQLSKYNLGSGFDWECEDIEEAIRTIRHEFAHITYRNHSGSHAVLTMIYTRKVINNIRLKNSIYYTKEYETEIA